MESATCKARFESGIFERTGNADVRAALARLEVLDARLGADLALAQAANPAVGLVLACLRLQLLVAAERLLMMVSQDAAVPDTLAAARTLLSAYERAIMDARSAVIRVSVYLRAA